jgi:selenocysteine lyase/cysteine desulfurase
VGKIPLDVNEMNIDAMSISGHKIYGPKGIGAAYVRRRPRVRLEPILSGGGQERGLRSGTLPASLVVGMGEAARIAKVEMAVSVGQHYFGDDEIRTPSRYERRELSRDVNPPLAVDGFGVSEDPLCRGAEPQTIW